MTVLRLCEMKLPTYGILPDGDYPLSVETEVFWRRGGPP